MKRNKVIPAALVLLSVSFFTGCFGVNAEFHRLKHSVLSRIGDGYYTDVEFGIGSLELSFAKTAVTFSDEHGDKDAKEVLKYISKMQVGVYKQRQHHQTEISKDFFYNTDKELTDEGWQYVVRDRSCKALTTVYYKVDDDGEITELLVVSLDRHELVIADLEGNFNKVIAEAVSRGSFSVDM